MKYRPYLEGSLPVSAIGLGAWQLGVNSGWKSVSEKTARDIVHKAIEHGVNFFDTAPNYGRGSGEERLGQELGQYDREKIVINTKFGHTHKGQLNFSSEYIRDSLEGSLRRLKMDYVDSLIIHNPPIEYLDGNQCEHYDILEKLKEEGKIKAYGASVDTHSEINTLLDTTDSKVIEVFFNILHQGPRHAFQKAKEKGVGIIIKVPLDSGWLTGKYNAQSQFNDIRSRWSEQDIRIRSELVDKVKRIMPNKESLSQMALAFCLSYDGVSTVIPGNVSVDQLMSNLKSADMVLSDTTRQELETFFDNEVDSLALPW